MRQKIGVLAVCYGSREIAMMDALTVNPDFKPTFYVYDKQRNPFSYNLATQSGGVHTIGSLTDIGKIIEFIKPHKSRIDFAIVGSEDPIIAGLKDELEKIGIVALCPSSEYAIEGGNNGGKIKQRELIAKVCPEANPEYRKFLRKDYSEDDPQLKRDFLSFYSKLNGMVAIKPDLPGHGAGVMVAVDHFNPNDEEEAYRLFLKNYKEGDVIVEEKLDCEEFSGQYFSDGKILVACPDTRDFKRRLDGDHGNNTGGMATLKGYGDILPFMAPDDRKLAIDYANRIFKEMKGGDARNPGLLGMPLYIAFAITDKGLKIFEINSRPGDPEIITVLPLIKKPSFAEICMRMREGDLSPIEFDERMGLLLYKVPPNYGGVDAKFEKTRIGLDKAYKFRDSMNGEGETKVLIYPGSAEQRDNGEIHALKSRTVASLGFGDDLDMVGTFSKAGIKEIEDFGLEFRKDPADSGYWAERKSHANELRAKARA